jgi:hypothetical protein
MSKKKDPNLVEAPVVEIKNNRFILHNYRTITGKTVLTQAQAALLYIELHKFLMLEPPKKE